MDVGSVDCVSLPDAAAPAADDAGRGLGTLLAAARASYPKVATAGGVHELLECPVCTISMFPPIHQVTPFFSSSLDWGNFGVMISIGVMISRPRRNRNPFVYDK